MKVFVPQPSIEVQLSPANVKEVFEKYLDTLTSGIHRADDGKYYTWDEHYHGSDTRTEVNAKEISEVCKAAIELKSAMYDAKAFAFKQSEALRRKALPLKKS